MLATLLLTACHKQESRHVVSVGTISGPETQLMQVAAKVALQKYHLHVKIVTFSDYILPNQALANGAIDANIFHSETCIVPLPLQKILA